MPSSSKRIIINTIATYSRTIVGILLVLFSSRWVLLELGTSDFGLFSLIGSILVFISFLNTVLANGDSRFFALMIGQQNSIGLRNLFKSSFVLHAWLAPILVLCGLIIGEVAIRSFLNIPDTRIDAALFLLYISLVAVFFNMLSVPFRALFIAHQNILSSSIIELVQTILFFIIAFLIRFYNGDKLIFYSFLYASVQIIIYLAFIVYAMHKYNYCVQLRSSNIDKTTIRSLLKYAFWNSLGDLGHLIRTQGTAIVVNLLFGTHGNAALGIANQVSMQASGLSNSLLNATSPEIYRRTGTGDINSAMSLSEMLNKIAILLIAVLAIPIIVNIDELLELWLVNVPEHAANLCIAFIVMFIIERYTTGFLIMLKAVNHIAKVQTAIFISYSLSIIFPYCGLCDYWGIEGIGISCVLSMILSRVAIWMNYKKIFRLSLRTYYIKVVFGSAVILILITCVAKYCFSSFGNIGLLNIIWTSLLLAFITTISIYCVVFNKKERNALLKLLKRSSK